MMILYLLCAFSTLLAVLLEPSIGQARQQGLIKATFGLLH